MDKKNTIFIVIDSLFYDKTRSQEYHHSPMPFLDKLRSEGYDYTHMFSEAPYTEAALVSLLCGEDTLKSGGYIKKMYGKKTVMEVFKDNGYDTFCNCVQPLVYPSYSYQGISDEYYNICYDFYTLWSYRLEFYSNLFKKDGLDDRTILLIVDLLKDNLFTWKNFLLALRDDKKILSFIKPFVSYDKDIVKKDIITLDKEIKRFNYDGVSYVKNLLTIGKEHVLFKITKYELNKKLDYDSMKKIYDRYKKIIRKVFINNMFYNLKNNKLVLSKGENKNLIKAYINSFYNRFLFKKIDYNDSVKKGAPSMDTTFEFFEDWLLKRKSDKPYFAYLHVDDCHSGEIFYTYDTNDFDKLDFEFNKILEYIRNLPKTYKGSLSYDISLQYADICLNRLYDFLEKNHMIDNVNIVVCADHGSSYTFNPYRSNYVNNIHRENYNMPFVIWNKDLKHKEKNGFYNTKDIPATILKLNNLDIPKCYDGISTFDNDGRDYVLLENVKGGCPDYNLRDFWIGIRNKKYLIVYNGDINKDFDELELFAVYDLVNDYQELYNLKNNIDKKSISKEIGIIRKEFNELKNDMIKNNFLNSLGEK